MLRGHTFTHFVGGTPISPTAPTTVDPAVFAAADVMVVTGGAFTDWTFDAHTRLRPASLPVVYVEVVSYALSQLVPATAPEFAAVCVVNDTSAVQLGTHFGCAARDVRVVGHPECDVLPPWRPRPRHVTVFGTVGHSAPDRQRHLRDAVELLAADGWGVTVRRHPRGRSNVWDDFTIDRSPTPAAAASSAQMTLGYLSSSHVQLAAMGVPSVVCAQEPWMLADSCAHNVAPCTLLHDTADIVAVAARVRPPSPVNVAGCCGPRGSAASSVFDVIETVTAHH